MAKELVKVNSSQPIETISRQSTFYLLGKVLPLVWVKGIP